MNIRNIKDYKTSARITRPEVYQKYINHLKEVYIVPLNKNYRYIRPNNGDDINKKIVAYVEYGNPSYNSNIKIYEDGTWSQYRDGCFFEYVGRIAI